MTRPYTDLTAGIGAYGDPDRFDPRPLRMSGWRALILIGMALALAVAWIHEVLS